jgi:hypothetical protein
VPDPRNIRRHLNPVGQPHASHFAQRGIRLLRRLRIHPRAYSAPLRRSLQRRGRRLVPRRRPSFFHQLIECRQTKLLLPLNRSNSCARKSARIAIPNRFRFSPRDPRRARFWLDGVITKLDLLRVRFHFPAQTRTCDGDRACLQPRICAGPTEQPIPFRSSGPHSSPGLASVAGPDAIQLQSSGRATYRSRTAQPLTIRAASPLRHTSHRRKSRLQAAF